MKNTRESMSITFTPFQANQKCTVEVCEWSNGEGYDISIDDNCVIGLADQEWRAISAVLNMMQLIDPEV